MGDGSTCSCAAFLAGAEAGASKEGGMVMLGGWKLAVRVATGPAPFSTPPLAQECPPVPSQKAASLAKSELTACQ